MIQKVRGKRFPVLQRGRRGNDQLFEIAHPDALSGKLLHLPFPQRTADEKIQCHIDSLRFRLSKNTIHPIHLHRINLRGNRRILPDQISFKVMKPEKIVAAFPHDPRKLSG